MKDRRQFDSAAVVQVPARPVPPTSPDEIELDLPDELVEELAQALARAIVKSIRRDAEQS